jgi:hypothetical protein
MRIILLFSILLAFSCSEDKTEKKEDEKLITRSCMKKGHYCYTPKPGFAFVEKYCLDDGGELVYICDADPIVTCDGKYLEVRIYDEKQTCDNS